MDIFKILGFCLCALVLLSVLRQYNPGYAVLAALACCMVLLWFVMQALGPVLSFVETLSQFSGFEHLGTVFKAVAIALMAQSVQDLCMEAGQTALAGRVELAGKVAVLLAAMPAVHGADGYVAGAAAMKEPLHSRRIWKRLACLAAMLFCVAAAGVPALAQEAAGDSGSGQSGIPEEWGAGHAGSANDRRGFQRDDIVRLAGKGRGNTARELA